MAGPPFDSQPVGRQSPPSPASVRKLQTTGERFQPVRYRSMTSMWMRRLLQVKLRLLGLASQPVQ